MGLIICYPKKAEHPLYVEDLGVRISTLEELCYIIHEFPIILDERFLESGVISFVKYELGINLHVEGQKCDEIFLGILSLGDYYSANEIDHFRMKLSELRTMETYRFLKMRGDFMFSIQRYGRAIRFYTDAVSAAEQSNASKNILSQLFANIGSANANLFRYDAAFAAYKSSLEYEQNRNVVKMIYFLSFMDPVIENKETYQSFCEGRIDPAWDREYDTITEKVRTSVAVDKLREELNRDALKRAKTISDYYVSWKQDYRKMIE